MQIQQISLTYREIAEYIIDESPVLWSTNDWGWK